MILDPSKGSGMAAPSAAGEPLLPEPPSSQLPDAAMAASPRSSRDVEQPGATSPDKSPAAASRPASALRSSTGGKKRGGNVKIGVTDHVYYATGRQRPPPAAVVAPVRRQSSENDDPDAGSYSTPADINWDLIPGG